MIRFEVERSRRAPHRRGPSRAGTGQRRQFREAVRGEINQPSSFRGARSASPECITPVFAFSIGETCLASALGGMGFARRTIFSRRRGAFFPVAPRERAGSLRIKLA